MNLGLAALRFVRFTLASMLVLVRYSEHEIVLRDELSRVQRRVRSLRFGCAAQGCSSPQQLVGEVDRLVPRNGHLLVVELGAARTNLRHVHDGADETVDGARRRDTALA